MLKPLFSPDCELVGWLDLGKHIFDTDMNWVAYIVNDHAWSSKTGNWLGKINIATCLDTTGKVIAWNPDCKVRGEVSCLRPFTPFKPFAPFTPFKPFTPFTPFTPFRPATPSGGWSSLSFKEWITQ